VTPGGLFSTDFVAGRIYEDEFVVQVPPNTPPDTYFLEVGWQNPRTGEQLDPLAGAIQEPLRPLWRSVLLPSITVR
jgi:hypothetical protein